jgi:EAL domain-containing protein (putative c-di-GMP-specific phosphodiesterase class I)
MENLVTLDFPDAVTDAAHAAHLPIARLTLEITESRLMHDRLALLDNTTRLRLKQIGLSIDDFGTGCSSLAQLRDLPFDELKLDRSFVHGAAGDPSLRAIVEANIRMGQRLGMRVVAEGVENLDDWEYVIAAGCDRAQGYFIARPMPGPDLPLWLNEWQHRLVPLRTSA